MMKFRFQWFGLFALILATIGSESRAETILETPSGLNPGDHFRFVFVTKFESSPTSSNIATYDTFVDNAATAAGLTYNGADLQWQVIGSTAAVSAVSRLPTSIADPFYRLDGVKIADNGADLWDASIDAPLNIDETFATQINFVFTGSNADGTVDASNPLGGTFFVHTGSSGLPNFGWISQIGGSQPKTFSQSFYAVSEDLTVPGSPVPEPGTLTLCIVGLGSLMARREWPRQRRRATTTV